VCIHRCDVAYDDDHKFTLFSPNGQNKNNVECVFGNEECVFGNEECVFGNVECVFGNKECVFGNKEYGIGLCLW